MNINGLPNFLSIFKPFLRFIFEATCIRFADSSYINEAVTPFVLHVELENQSQEASCTNMWDSARQEVEVSDRFFHSVRPPITGYTGNRWQWDKRVQCLFLNNRLKFRWCTRLFGKSASVDRLRKYNTYGCGWRCFQNYYKHKPSTRYFRKDKNKTHSWTRLFTRINLPKFLLQVFSLFLSLLSRMSTRTLKLLLGLGRIVALCCALSRYNL